MKISNKQKAYIHIAKKQLNMDDKEYRAFLRGFKVNSSNDLTDNQFPIVKQKLQALGFKPIHKTAKKSRITNVSKDKKAQIDKIGALLADMKLSWTYADSIAKNVCKVEKLRFVPNDQLYKVITALVKHQKRHSQKLDTDQRNGGII